MANPCLMLLESLLAARKRGPYILKQALTRRIPQKSAVNSPTQRYPPRVRSQHRSPPPVTPPVPPTYIDLAI